MVAKLIKQDKRLPLGIIIDSLTPTVAPRSLSQQNVKPNLQGVQRINGFGYFANYNQGS